VNSDVSTETFVLTVRAPAVMPSTRSSWVLTCRRVVCASSSNGALPSCALRIATVASSRVRPSFNSGTAMRSTRTTNAPAATSAAI